MKTIIALGLGVQSTAMYLWAATGRIPDHVDCAIFADTGAERPETYQNLERILALNLSIPIHVVRRDLYADILAGNTNGRGKTVASIPAFVENGGMLMRQCTPNYKIQPIVKHIRQIHGLRPHQRMKPTQMWLGITVDEAHRMKPSRHFNMENRYPLVEMNLRRSDCISVVNEYGLIAAKSSCIFCPYQSDHQWKQTKENPTSWQMALNVDAKMRDLSAKGMKSKIFLHRNCVPLDDVDFDSQGDLFGNECEGHCGL